MSVTTNLDRVFASAPLNRTAAAVTAGGSADGELTAAQRRENLLSILRKIERAIPAATTSEAKKQLGQQKLRVCKALSDMKAEMQKVRDESYPDIFMDVAKEFLSKVVFESISKEVRRRVDAAREGRAP